MFTVMSDSGLALIVTGTIPSPADSWFSDSHGL